MGNQRQPDRTTKTIDSKLKMNTTLNLAETSTIEARAGKRLCAQHQPQRVQAIPDTAAGSLSRAALRPAPRPALSLREPVTPRNRARLKPLRAAEGRAWDSARPACTLPVAVSDALASQRAEARLFAGITVITAVAVALGLGASLNFTMHSEKCSALIQHLLM